MTSLDPKLFQYDKIVSLTGYASLQDHALREHYDTNPNPMVGMIAALRGKFSYDWKKLSPSLKEARILAPRSRGSSAAMLKIILN